MTNTTVFEKLSGGKGVITNTCCDTGCTYPVCTLQVIKEFGAEIMFLTQELVIIEGSGAEVQILGAAVMFLEAEVLHLAKKIIEAETLKRLTAHSNTH